MSEQVLGASFRDPSGFVFERDGLIHRQVNRCYAGDYDVLRASGLYEKLTSEDLLVAHQEIAGTADDPLHYKTLLPEQLDFVSYPYEWSFSALKDAALLTLRIQRIALDFGMTLKDASAYNVQFQRGRPLFIDSLSFERYREGEAWVGYRQFCQHFLAPLALMALRDVRLLQLLRVHIDGIPLDLASKLLPARAWLRAGLLMNIRLHASFQQRHARSADRSGERPESARKLSRQALQNLIASLEGVVRKLSFEPAGTEWADYYEGDGYTAASLERKQALVAEHLARIAPASVWDLGSNTGVYSRVAADGGARVVAFDVDPACVERSYRELRKEKRENLLPLLLDLTNPSPAIGWANAERLPIARRGCPDAVLALALVHHLAISNNVPLPKIADHFAELSDQLVIEFVPKSDAKVKTLLATRVDIFPDYTRDGFEFAFRTRFEILASDDIEGSDRTLYRMKRRG
jgi:ribosomal protein L11 methylase PrmA